MYASPEPQFLRRRSLTSSTALPLTVSHSLCVALTEAAITSDVESVCPYALFRVELPARTDGDFSSPSRFTFHKIWLSGAVAPGDSFFMAVVNKDHSPSGRVGEGFTSSIGRLALDKVISEVTITACPSECPIHSACTNQTVGTCQCEAPFELSDDCGSSYTPVSDPVDPPLEIFQSGDIELAFADGAAFLGMPPSNSSGTSDEVMFVPEGWQIARFSPGLKTLLEQNEMFPVNAGCIFLASGAQVEQASFAGGPVSLACSGVGSTYARVTSAGGLRFVTDEAATSSVRILLSRGNFAAPSPLPTPTPTPTPTPSPTPTPIPLQDADCVSGIVANTCFEEQTSWSAFGLGFTYVAPPPAVSPDSTAMIRVVVPSNDERGGAGQNVVLPSPRASIVISAYAFSTAPPAIDPPLTSDFSIYLDVELDDGTFLWGEYGAFDPHTTGQWQRTAVRVTNDRLIRRFTLYLLYRNMAGEVYFDNVHLES